MQGSPTEPRCLQSSKKIIELKLPMHLHPLCEEKDAGQDGFFGGLGSPSWGSPSWGSPSWGSLSVVFWDGVQIALGSIVKVFESRSKPIPDLTDFLIDADERIL